MAGFSYQQHSPFLIDPPCLPNTPVDMSFLKQAGPYNYFSCESITEASNTDARTYESSCSLDNGPRVAVEPKTQTASLEKKRKSGHESCLSPSQQPRESKSRKQKKPNGGLKRTEDKKSEDHSQKEETKASEEPPTGYIHVRARRGQATDSHSLAERVRRERIRLRMKVLQGLVPGCDKVAGKALMLDEIINYVQSLQNQVEFLSMTLASVNPMLYDFGVDFDDCMNQPDPLPSLQQTNHILPTVHEEATSSYQFVSPPAPHLFMHGQGPSAFSQDIKSYQMQAADDHHQGFIGLVGFNLCSFQ